MVLKRIGITSRRAAATRVFPAETQLLGEETVQVHFSALSHHVQMAGGFPIPIPWELPAAETIAQLDGLVLSGGEDVEPGRSGAASASVVDPARDRLELELLAEASLRELPVLGICRGMQLMNVARGGSLKLVPGHDRRDLHFTVRSERVSLDPGSPGERIYGPEAEVNSVHSQGIDRLGTGLTAIAWAGDGTIEAFAAEDAPWLAVQWHPEYMEAPDPSFRWLLEAIGANALHGLGSLTPRHGRRDR